MVNDIARPVETSTDAKTNILTEVELFHRFLDAPIRSGAASTLVAPAGPQRSTSQENFLEFFSFESACFGLFGLSERIIDELRVSEHPASELENAVADIHGLLDSLRTLQTEFTLLREATRTEQPDDDAPDEAFADWEDNPRYVLPLIA